MTLDTRGLPLRVWTVGRIDHLFRDCPAIRHGTVYARSRAGLGEGRTAFCRRCLARYPMPTERGAA